MCSSVCVVSNDRFIMYNSLRRIWKEAVVAKFEVLYWGLYGVTEESHRSRPNSRECKSDVLCLTCLGFVLQEWADRLQCVVRYTNV